MNRHKLTYDFLKAEVLSEKDFCVSLVTFTRSKQMRSGLSILQHTLA